MALEERSNGNTTYLQIDYGKKSMYIWSGDEKEGFEKHTSEKGNVSYRKYISAVSGYIVATYFRDGNFGPELTMIFEDEGLRYSLSFGIDSSVFSSIARSIENVDINKKVRLAVYDSKSKTSGKSYFGVSLSYPDIPGDNGKATLVEWGEELPQGKQLRTGKWDFSEAQDEAYSRFERFIEKSDFENRPRPKADVEEVAEEKSVPKKTTKKSSEPVEEDENLPF